MITANDARKKVEESGVEVQKYLNNKIEPKVVEAAEMGKTSIIVFIGAKDLFSDMKITPIEKAVVKELEALGYTANIKVYGDTYVPRGLADDDGKGPTYTNYGFHIGW